MAQVTKESIDTAMSSSCHLEEDFVFVNFEELPGSSEKTAISCDNKDEEALKIKKEEVSNDEDEEESEEELNRVSYSQKSYNSTASHLEFLDYEESRQWRRKDEARLNAKKKVKNYQVKVVQDYEMIKKGLQKWIPTEVLKSIGDTYQHEKESCTVFYGNAFDSWAHKVGRKTRSVGKYLVPAFVKVWNKPSKEFLENTKPYYQHDPVFMEKIESAPSEFNRIWAQREFDNYKKISSVGIKVPKILFHENNVIIFRYSHNKLYEEKGPYGPNEQQYYFEEPKFRVKTLASCIEKVANVDGKLKTTFEEVVQIMKDLYNKAGLVHGNLTMESILEDGCISNIAQAMDIYYPGVDQFLFRDCQNVAEFFAKVRGSDSTRGTKITPEALFEEITGYGYKLPNEPSHQISEDETMRKLERKSKRNQTNVKIAIAVN